MAALGKKQVEFAKSVGMNQSYLSQVIRGKYEPRSYLLDAIEKSWGISRRWLETGEGEMFVPPPAAARVTVETSGLVAVPLYADPVAAGAALINNEEIEDYAWIHKNQIGRRKNLIAVRIQGDSMAPVLRSGDIVVIDRDDRTPPGVFCVRLDEGATVKRVKLIGRQLLITAENREEFQEVIVSPARVRDVLIGRVVWQWSDLSGWE